MTDGIVLPSTIQIVWTEVTDIDKEKEEEEAEEAEEEEEEEEKNIDRGDRLRPWDNDNPQTSLSISSDDINIANTANIANATNTANIANIISITNITSITNTANDIDVMPLLIDAWYAVMGGQLAKQLYDTSEMNI